MSYPQVKLTGILHYLEEEQETDQPFLFVNPTGELETFFTYKGNMKELYKMKIKMALHPESKDEIKEELHSSLECGMKIGDWVVFNIGKDSKFDIIEFLKAFPFFHKDMFKPSKIHDKKFVLQNNILRTENDTDGFGNKGFMKIQDRFKFCFLTTCPFNEVEELLKVNKELDFNVLFVTN